MRRAAITSISKYLKAPYRTSYSIPEKTPWKDVTDFINGIDKQSFNSQLIMYLPGFLHQQNFKCYVTGQLLLPKECHIHHKKPLYKGGTNEFKNLVLIDKSVHKELHHSDGSSYNGVVSKRFKALQSQL